MWSPNLIYCIDCWFKKKIKYTFIATGLMQSRCQNVASSRMSFAKFPSCS